MTLSHKQRQIAVMQKVSIALVLEIAMWNSIDSYKARIQTASIHWNDFDPDRANGDNKKATAREKQNRVYAQITLIYNLRRRGIGLIFSGQWHL